VVPSVTFIFGNLGFASDPTGRGFSAPRPLLHHRRGGLREKGREGEVEEGERTERGERKAILPPHFAHISH